jgi:carbon storage regulator
MLVLSRKTGESLVIGDEIEISIVEVKGDKVRIAVKAPRDIPVHRKEVYEQIREENRDAASLPEELNLEEILFDSKV